jgi:TRAP-type C4-dicarboxylate transport system permease small subunit
MTLGKYMDILAGIFLTFIILLTVCDVILRYFGMPILGAYEIVSLGGALIIGISSFLTYWKKSHIRVDTFVNKYPGTISHILYIITRVAILFIVGLTGWGLIMMGVDLLETHEVTVTLRIIYYPVVWALGVSFLMIGLGVVYHMISGRGDR